MTADTQSPTISIRFTVKGFPVTQGSKTPQHIFNARGNCSVWLRDDNAAELKQWRALVRTGAERAMTGRERFSGPLLLLAAFYFPRPKSHTRKQRENPFVHGGGRYDVEKLVRAINDAMTEAEVWADDAQVSVLLTEKRYAEQDENVGVIINVQALDADTPPIFFTPEPASKPQLTLVTDGDVGVEHCVSVQLGGCACGKVKI